MSEKPFIKALKEAFGEKGSYNIYNPSLHNPARSTIKEQKISEAYKMNEHLYLAECCYNCEKWTTEMGDYLRCPKIGSLVSLWDVCDLEDGFEWKEDVVWEEK